MSKIFKYNMFEVFDGQTQNELQWDFNHPLKQYDTFEVNDVTYMVLEVDFFEDEMVGKAIVQMTRYKIPDESTQFVHVCPAKKDADTKMDRDDMVKLEEQLGTEAFQKHVKKWNKQNKRVKMRSYNTLETKCPGCEVVFWKKYNSVPPTVVTESTLGKAVLKKRREK